MDAVSEWPVGRLVLNAVEVPHQARRLYREQHRSAGIVPK